MSQWRCPSQGCDSQEFCYGCNNCIEHCKCTQLEKTVAEYKKVAKFAADAMGPDAPTVTNAEGGKQSFVPFRCDALPGKALLQIAGILKEGLEKYGKDNWRKIPRYDHVNHALAHLFALGAGDDSDDHLGHAACRLLFALETQ